MLCITMLRGQVTLEEHFSHQLKKRWSDIKIRGNQKLIMEAGLWRVWGIGSPLFMHNSFLETLFKMSIARYHSNSTESEFGGLGSSSYIFDAERIKDC